jgi:hypothetical protein
MAQFKYTLPSGSEFTMNAPNGTTQAEADKIFYSQVAAGAFIGYRVNDTLTQPQTALNNFGLSRLERGTAPVDNDTLLAVINGLPVVAPLPPLVNTPIQNPINQADYVNITTGLGPAAIGSLSAKEVNALMAQTAAIVGQDANAITQEKGLGLYGFNCEALERAGYVKPGTAERYMNGQSVGTEPNPDNFVAVLSSPSVWTGKDGVVSVDAVLVDENTQNKIQAQLMENSYYSMVTAGLITPTAVTQTAPVSTGQTWGIGQTLMATSALTLVATAFGYNGTNKLFGDFKNIISGNTLSDSVSSFGGSVSTLASGAYNTLGNININQAGALATTVATSVNADVGALVANASKYGPQASQLWAKSSNIGVDGIANIGTAGFASAQAFAGNIYAQGTAAAGAALTGLQGQATALQAQAKAAMDTLGKASQSAVNFSNYSISGLVSGVQPGAAFNNTVDRSTVDAAVTRMIGSDKIQSPSFELPSLASIGTSKDLAQAQNFLKTAQEAGQSIVNQGQSAFSQVAQIAGSAQNQGSGLLNAARSFGGGRGLG